MIAQLILSTLLAAILLYAWTEYRRSPVVALTVSSPAGILSGSQAQHATRGAGRDRPRRRPLPSGLHQPDRRFNLHLQLRRRRNDHDAAQRDREAQSSKGRVGKARAWFARH
jgi:hypothetical protein